MLGLSRPHAIIAALLLPVGAAGYLHYFIPTDPWMTTSLRHGQRLLTPMLAAFPEAETIGFLGAAAIADQQLAEYLAVQNFVVPRLVDQNWQQYSWILYKAIDQRPPVVAGFAVRQDLGENYFVLQRIANGETK